MIDLAELMWGRYNGGQQGPIGTYINLRTLEYYQQASDGPLPQDGTFCFISTNATLTTTQIASTVNAVLSTTYTASSFHAHTATDLIGTPGQMSNDA